MKKLLFVTALALSVAGCADFQTKLATFTGNVVAVNNSIAQISASLAQNCNGIHDAAVAIQGLAAASGATPKTNGAIAAANAVISTWCQNPPSDITSAIQVTAAEVAAARAAYQAAKNGS